ncbi:SIS domain-containing protein [Syntrophomonas palmitatica]|uniref:SIS domain-containing protein n=1 Tax=Syntrophomonas palmitatica TaxID=402877 RepID=UPI000AB3536A|nr:SIS domain-containing protein [Syntrophomonas palmitatica]
MELTPEMMMDYLYGLPEQFVQCLAMDFSFAAQYAREYRNIVVSGLGGSAIGGDILRSYALHQAQAPVSVIRGYDIPAFVGADTLFLATSYSGNTEETLSAFEQARQKGASIICVSSGGQISRWAEEQGLGLVKVPGGLVPRAATGYLFAPLAICLEKLGIISGAVSGLQETVEVLKELRDSLIPTVEAPENKAREIARRLKDAVPVIWGSTGNTEQQPCAGRRRLMKMPNARLTTMCFLN